MNKLTFFCLFAALHFGVSAQSHDLKLNLETGKTYHQNSQSEIVIKQLLDGQPFDMTMSIDGKVSLTVTAKEGDQYRINVQYEEISLGMVMDGQESMYSSKSIDTNDIVSILLGAMQGNPFQLSLSEKGRVTQITNINSWVQPALEKLSRFPEDIVGPVIDQVVKTYGEDALRGNIELTTAIFPDKPVAVGESWSVKTRLNGSVKADVLTEFTLTSNNKKETIIEGKAAVTSDKNAAPMETAGGNVQYDLKGTLNSTLTLDAASGWISTSTYSQVLKGDNIITTPYSPEPMKVPMELISEMKISDQ
jgi:hypothetical protein